MNKYNLKDFFKGWFIGNFEPTLDNTDDFELSKFLGVDVGLANPLSLDLMTLLFCMSCIQAVVQIFRVQFFIIIYLYQIPRKNSRAFASIDGGLSN